MAATRGNGNVDLDKLLKYDHDEVGWALTRALEDRIAVFDNICLQRIVWIPYTGVDILRPETGSCAACRGLCCYHYLRPVRARIINLNTGKVQMFKYYYPCISNV